MSFTVKDRNELHEQLQRLLAGHPLDLVYSVASDAVAISISLMSETLEEADKVIEDGVADFKRTIRLNWEATRESRANMLRDTPETLQ